MRGDHVMVVFEEEYWVDDEELEDEVEWDEWVDNPEAELDPWELEED